MVCINERFSVAGQITSADVAEVAAAGFYTIVNNRPDGEEPAQPHSQIIKATAEGEGLCYFHLPVRGLGITDDKVRAFQNALESSNGPVFAHCRSGTRSLTLFVIGEVLDGRMRADDVMSFGIQHGFDLSGAAAWLHSRSGQ
jgi:uncharacterized protein (TIGR01244 family)